MECGVLELFPVEVDGLFDDGVGVFDAASDLSLANDLDQLSVVQVLDVTVERGLCHIAEPVPQRQRRHRLTNESLNDAKADGVEE